MKKLVSVFIWLLVVVPCQADIITVNSDGSGDYPTIQAAIDGSNS